MTLRAGDRLGDYQVIEALGAGGMGQVYRVKNLISGRTEAMKVLLPDLSDEPQAAERFVREIRVLAGLSHPNIAALYTAQWVENQLVMIMEFVEGVTLARKLRAGPLPLAAGLGYVGQVLSALAYAHQHGVIHRDIKPANVMITPEDRVKLTDFGIAKAAGEPKLTRTGMTVGSLYYMSPEQIQGKGESLDGRSDLYSVGVVLYEVATGKRPFEADSDFALMVAHLQQPPPPPIALAPALPLELNEIILKALAKNPDQRYQTAEAFEEALRTCLAESARQGPGWAPAPHAERIAEPYGHEQVPPTPASATTVSYASAPSSGITSPRVTCSRCGAVAPSQAKRCASCGADLIMSAPEVAPSARAGTGTGWASWPPPVETAGSPPGPVPPAVPPNPQPFPTAVVLGFAVVLAVALLALGWHFRKSLPLLRPAPGSPPSQRPVAAQGGQVTEVSYADLVQTGSQGGDVSYHRGDDDKKDDWQPLPTNAPVSPGDSVYTRGTSRAEIALGQRSFLRLGNQACMSIVQNNDQLFQFKLTSGTATLVVGQIDASYEADTPAISFVAEQAGKYRFDVGGDGSTDVVVEQGQGVATTSDGANETLTAPMTFRMRAAPGAQPQTRNNVQPDAWDSWSDQRDTAIANSPSQQYLPPGVEGYESLDAYGRWLSTLDHGTVWVPAVERGWAPYRIGHWIWVDPYGWTWASYEPWGWAPYHYGRWALVPGTGWAWIPGPVAVPQPFEPALVGFVGGDFGGPWVGWFPLGPGEVCQPVFFQPLIVRPFNQYVNYNYITVVNRSEIYESTTVVYQTRQIDPQVIARSQDATFATIRPTEHVLYAPAVRITRLGAKTAMEFAKPVLTPPAQIVGRPVVARTNEVPAVVPFKEKLSELAKAGRSVSPVDASRRINIAPKLSTEIAQRSRLTAPDIRPRKGTTGTAPGSRPEARNTPSSGSSPRASAKIGSARPKPNPPAPELKAEHHKVFEVPAPGPAQPAKGPTTKTPSGGPGGPGQSPGGGSQAPGSRGGSTSQPAQRGPLPIGPSPVPTRTPPQSSKSQPAAKPLPSPPKKKP